MILTGKESEIIVMEQLDDIKVIEGEILRDIGRASDMAWLSIGRTIEVNNLKGEKILKGTYAIHIQCPWRMVDTKNNIILFTSHDMYLPNKELNGNEHFDWDIQGENLYDKKVQEWKRKYPEVVINHIQVNRLGDLSMQLSNCHTIELFMNTSTNNECWRFFECNTGKKHVVFQGTGQSKE